MRTFHGTVAECAVMTDDIESTAVKQIEAFLECPAFEGSKIRIMPDVHAGAGAVIGFTATLTDKVIPNVVGVDIGCGVASVNVGPINNIDFADLDRCIRQNVPSGFAVHDAPTFLIDDGLHNEILEACAATEQDPDRAFRSIGTLGGGNHFIELGRDEARCGWLTVHSGSRNFGLRIATWHQQKAIEAVGKRNGLEWLEGQARDLYLRHMEIAQAFALANRRRMLDVICGGYFGVNPSEANTFESVHNYIDFADRVIRKGAIAARAGQRVVIPWNMRDGLIIGTGRGNAEWNRSAPHGAGRTMGRGQAKRTLQVADFEREMRGVWSSCVSSETLDESPMAYKPADAIRAAIADTVDVERTVKPVYNFKAA